MQRRSSSLHLLQMLVVLPSAFLLDVFVAHLVVRLAKHTTYEKIKTALKDASESEELKGIIAYTEDAVVSADFVGQPASPIFDATGGIMLNESSQPT